MKVKFVQLNKTTEPWLKEGCRVYIDRLVRYISFEAKEVEAQTRSKDLQVIMEAEAKLVLGLLKPADYLILLDDKGEEFTSEKFAVWMNKKFVSAGGDIVFLTGGAYGFHQSLYDRSNARLSLSKLTFTHQMARLIFLEQLYRAMTILRNEPYHHS